MWLDIDQYSDKVARARAGMVISSELPSRRSEDEERLRASPVAGARYRDGHVARVQLEAVD